MSAPLTPSEKSALWHHMREPLFSFGALLVLLAANVAIGWLQPFPAAWVLEGAVMVAMIAVVLLVSMDVIAEPALIKLFAVLGFCWVGILFAMTLVDYLTR